MKPIKQITLLIAIAAFVVLSCNKKEYKLGTLPEKSQINMEVKQDLTVDAGGNTVYLINHTDGIQPFWYYTTGKSMRRVDTVRYAFAGTYKVARSAVTAGGIVYLDTVTINVTKDNLNYVDDPLWNALSGGVGKEKTWVWDIDANGKCKVFIGPLFFSGSDNGWKNQCMKAGGDCWSWWPKYDDIKAWIGIPPADYGTMTFSLKGGANVKVVHNTLPSRGTENGTYYINRDTKMLTLTNATPLHSSALDNCAVSWSDLKLIELTDTKMQLGYIRTAGCGGKATIILNYYAQ